MKNHKTITFSVLFILLLSFVNCKKQQLYNKSSRGTGWQMTGTIRGVKNALDLKGQDTAPGLVFIEGGSFVMGKVEDDSMHDWNNQPTRQHVQSFYMDEAEVTNAIYLEYITWIKKVFPPNNENYKNIHNGVTPDTLVWRNRIGYSEAMVKNYLRHPAYSQYPVVGVNWVQAVEFSKWRTDRVNEAILEKYRYLKKDAKTNDVSAESSFSTETYLAAPTMTYGGNETIILKAASGTRTLPSTTNKKPIQEKKDSNVYAQRSTGILYPEYRLPTEAEWEYAAAADVGQREYNNYKGQRKYPWSGSYTASAKKGKQLANFKQAKGDYGGITGRSIDHGDITNEIKRYPPNDFGLYDMAGNVSEWVADVYRPIIDAQTNDFNYYRGNIFTKNKIGKNGKIELVTKENIKYDTLINGRIVALNFPGQIISIPIGDNETFLRQNFDQSYLVNYKDGDPQSTKYLKMHLSNSTNKNDNNSDKMYHTPQHSILIDSLGNILKNHDKSNIKTTLINDKSRVYKGGSWKDRAYWLSPSQRRYLSQDMSTDYIGFRCAMSRVSLKANKNRSRKN